MNKGGVNMNAYEAIYSRRTVRDFADKEIDMDTVKKLLSAGLQAPTNDHMRSWEFVILTNRLARAEAIDLIKKDYPKDEVMEIMDNWEINDKYQREMYSDGIPKQYEMLLNAGCLILPFYKHKGELLKPVDLSALNPFASIWCCIENILIAAADEGIQGVTRIPFKEEIKHVKEYLNIPESYEFPCYIALGYPAENAKTFPPKAVNVENKIHINRW